MKISPNLSDVKKVAATGKYNVLPVSCEILSDFTTPIETMKIIVITISGRGDKDCATIARYRGEDIHE